MRNNKHRMIGKVLCLVIITTSFLSYKCFAQNSTVPQKHQIVGKVVDSQTNKPLIGANILVKGTTNGTLTNSSGTYSIQVESLQDTLVFSYIGYKTKTVPISGRTEINVAMQKKVEALQQLTVVGYGKKKR